MWAHNYGIGILLLETQLIALTGELSSHEMTRPIALMREFLPHIPLGAKYYFPIFK